jgi:hypothetical protein
MIGLLFKKKKFLLYTISIINDKSINKILMTEKAEPIIIVTGIKQNKIRK